MRRPSLQTRGKGWLSYGGFCGQHRRQVHLLQSKKQGWAKWSIAADYRRMAALNRICFCQKRTNFPQQFWGWKNCVPMCPFKSVAENEMNVQLNGHWKKKKWSHFDLKSWVNGGSKIRSVINWLVIGEYLSQINSNFKLTLNIESIWLKYFPINRNSGSNFSSASDSTFYVKMTQFFLSVGNC